MTAPDVCRVAAVQPLPPDVRRYPLATKTGIEMLSMILSADRFWRPLSARQQTALRVAYQTALDTAVAAGAAEAPLPELPVGTHPLTVRSLERRGLVAGGRLTGLGVEVTRWSIFMEQPRVDPALDPDAAASGDADQ